MKTNPMNTARKFTLIAALALSPLAFGQNTKDADDANKDSITKEGDNKAQQLDTEEARNRAEIEAKKAATDAKMAKENDNADSGKTADADKDAEAKENSTAGNGISKDGKIGPNGGKILPDVSPPTELFITPDREVMITFMDKDGKMIAPTDQSLAMITGDRSAPTKMVFEKTLNGYKSTNKLPEGNMIPAIIQIKTSPDAEQANVRMNINLADCPTCDHPEYACTCDHGAEDHEGHDHKEGEDHEGHDH